MIISKNNKGHGMPQIPDWVCYVFFAIIIGVPTIIVNAAVLGIQKLGYLNAYSPIVLTAVGVLLLAFFFYCIHRYDKYEQEKAWKAYEKEHDIK